MCEFKLQYLKVKKEGRRDEINDQKKSREGLSQKSESVMLCNEHVSIFVQIR